MQIQIQILCKSFLPLYSSQFQESRLSLPPFVPPLYLFFICVSPSLSLHPFALHLHLTRDFSFYLNLPPPLSLLWLNHLFFSVGVCLSFS